MVNAFFLRRHFSVETLGFHVTLFSSFLSLYLVLLFCGGTNFVFQNYSSSRVARMLIDNLDGRDFDLSGVDSGVDSFLHYYHNLFVEDPEIEQKIPQH